MYPFEGEPLEGEEPLWCELLRARPGPRDPKAGAFPDEVGGAEEG